MIQFDLTHQHQLILSPVHQNPNEFVILPEIIDEILKFLPLTHPAGLTCKHFYNANMRVKLLALQSNGASFKDCGIYFPKIAFEIAKKYLLKDLDFSGLNDYKNTTKIRNKNLAPLAYLNELVNIFDLDLKPIEHRNLQLNSLNISGHTKVTNQGFESIAIGQCSSLTHLNISECWLITDSAMPLIGSFIKLTKLDISPSQGRGVTVDCLKYINSLTLLTHLNISNIDLTKNGLENITSLTSLTYLDVSNCELTDEMTENLKYYSSLTHLNICESYDLTNALINNIHGLPLTVLNLAYCQHFNDFEPTKMPSLTHLDISNCPRITEITLENIKDSPLTILNLAVCKISEIGLKNLSVFPLKVLALESNPITDNELNCLEKLPLTTLYVRECPNISIARLLAFKVNAIKAGNLSFEIIYNGTPLIS